MRVFLVSCSPERNDDEDNENEEELTVSPEPEHEGLLLDSELLSVSTSELVEGESPSVETGSESDGSLLGVDLNVSEGLVVVGGDDNVDGLDGSGERLVELLLSDLQLEKSSIDLVDDNDGLDSLSKSLPEDWRERRRREEGKFRSNRSKRGAGGKKIENSPVSVWTQTPSMVSTTTRAPSVTRRAAVTSEEKST